MPNQVDIARQTARQFCLEFIQNPYLCYTEHGLHALLYTMLYNAMPADDRYTTWHNHKVCVVQKEYPTAASLGKPRRQHWDIALIKTPPQSLVESIASSYDLLRLAAAVEVGMNEPEEHLRDDVERLTHRNANIDQGFIIHLYRLAQSGAQLSDRDWSSASRRIVSKEHVAEMVAGKPVEVFYGLYDSAHKHEPGAWHIKEGVITALLR